MAIHRMFSRRACPPRRSAFNMPSACTLACRWHNLSVHPRRYEFHQTNVKPVPSGRPLAFQIPIGGDLVGQRVLLDAARIPEALAGPWALSPIVRIRSSAIFEVSEVAGMGVAPTERGLWGPIGHWPTRGRRDRRAKQKRPRRDAAPHGLLFGVADEDQSPTLLSLVIYLHLYPQKRLGKERLGHPGKIVTHIDTASSGCISLRNVLWHSGIELPAIAQVLGFLSRRVYR